MGFCAIAVLCHLVFAGTKTQHPPHTDHWNMRFQLRSPVDHEAGTTHTTYPAGENAVGDTDSFRIGFFQEHTQLLLEHLRYKIDLACGRLEGKYKENRCFSWMMEKYMKRKRVKNRHEALKIWQKHHHGTSNRWETLADGIGDSRYDLKSTPSRNKAHQEAFPKGNLYSNVFLPSVVLKRYVSFKEGRLHSLLYIY